MRQPFQFSDDPDQFSDNPFNSQTTLLILRRPFGILRQPFQFSDDPFEIMRPSGSGQTFRIQFSDDLLKFWDLPDPARPSGSNSQATFWNSETFRIRPDLPDPILRRPFEILRPSGSDRLGLRIRFTLFSDDPQPNSQTFRIRYASLHYILRRSFEFSDLPDRALDSATAVPPYGFFRIPLRVFVGFGRLMVRWNGKEQALHVLLDLAKIFKNKKVIAKKLL